MPNECEPACLKQIMNYFKIRIGLDELVSKISTDNFRWQNWDFNTARVAMSYGLTTTIYTTSTGIFDPTWFDLEKNELIGKLRKEIKFLKEGKYNGLPSYLEDATAALRYLESGGKIKFECITKELLEDALLRRNPLIAPVNYTLLRNAPRERYVESKDKWIPDDIKGNSYGHVVVIDGFTNDSFAIVDPWPKSKGKYLVNKSVLIDSILRNDANLIEVSKPF